jgi:hypothetical protein
MITQDRVVTTVVAVGTLQHVAEIAALNVEFAFRALAPVGRLLTLPEGARTTALLVPGPTQRLVRHCEWAVDGTGFKNPGPGENRREEPLDPTVAAGATDAPSGHC